MPVGKRKRLKWRRGKWHGTSDPAITSQFTCYILKYRRGRIYLCAYKEGQYFLECRYHFTASYGANSDDSYSGLLLPEHNGIPVQQAQSEALAAVKRMNRWN